MTRGPLGFTGLASHFDPIGPTRSSNTPKETNP
jgi:hypothetical protein